MSDARFVLDLFYGGLMAVLYGAVARAISRRKVSATTELASIAFMNWWGGLSALSVVGIFASIATRQQAWSLAGFLTYLDLVLILLAFLLMSLMYYFVFLFTGSKIATAAVVVAYIGYLAFLLFWINVQGPIGIGYEDGAVDLQYANDLTEEPISLWLGISLVVPLILGAFAYSTLYFRVETRLQKFRIITVGGSIFFWMLTSLGGTLGGVDQSASWWIAITRLVAVFATTANLFAFQPPAWLISRLKLEPSLAIDDS